MRIFRASFCAALFGLAQVVSPVKLAGATQEPSGLPVSLDRIREDLEKPSPPPLKPATPVQLRPTFKTRVDQRTWVPTLEEVLHKQFDLTPMQRQSAEWAARCCGLNLGLLVKGAEDAWRARKVRKTREQIARELAILEAATPASPPK